MDVTLDIHILKTGTNWQVFLKKMYHFVAVLSITVVRGDTYSD